MAKPDILSPEKDPSVVQMLVNNVWEIPSTLPVQAHHGIPLFDLTPRYTQEEIDISDEYVIAHTDHAKGLTFADSYIKSHGIDELINLEGNPDAIIIYDGYTVGKDPRLMK